ncbi:prenyltransferase/squalene oxidase repeat-containing protein [Rhodopirellula sp. MGV]|uniref:prenyltransferase/squalene oxidase repeat-containing protein n=1 Tax=Rhodopirellula sp. MGV TaxID=2023130 RepID=UPI000B965B10|nr:prenyltransferase/squalene oxidase repeat-containing protein [Rhodopirellula sp. MGV]OYP35764.1 squalene--hopene cyclase [Rhodopirellula sp. MGV]PNY33653.1 squalene--hopene cyclase [Rhodopirellula baltica]
MRMILVAVTLSSLLVCSSNRVCTGQDPRRQQVAIGQEVPREVREIYHNGLNFLKRTQDDRGTWPAGESAGPGTTSLALLAFLASGEDPNLGPYRETIRKALRHIIASQNEKTGYMGPSMYHHGFALLALSEAYGMVDDRDLFADSPVGARPLGQAVELAVRSALTSQQRNRAKAWRYSPGASDADTSVSGAVLMGLLAARNAGIEVPDEAINSAIEYFAAMTATDGTVGYTTASQGGLESLARSGIANLVMAIARRKDLPEYQQTGQYLIQHKGDDPGWPEYARYYQAQALFQWDLDVWNRWNEDLIRSLKSQQKDDGSFEGELGVTNSTSMSLLALGVNFRFLPIYER